MSKSPLTNAKNMAKFNSAAPDADLESGRPEEEFVVGKWEAELSDWSRHCIPNGWMVCFCPCVSLAQISARVDPGSFRSVMIKQLILNLFIWAVLVVELVFCFKIIQNAADEHFDSDAYIVSMVAIGGSVVVMTIFSLVMVRMIAKLRTRVRERFQIPGSEKDDKKQVGWCTPCVIAQMATQVKSYQRGSCAFNEPDALPAYIH